MRKAVPDVEKESAGVPSLEQIMKPTPFLRQDPDEKSTGESGEKVDEIVVHPGESGLEDCRALAVNPFFSDLAAEGTTVLCLKSCP